MTIPDPRHRLSGSPIEILGVTFTPYRTGILRSAWISPDGRLLVQTNYNMACHHAIVDGEMIQSTGKLRKAKAFRTRQGAMSAAVETMQKKDSAK